MNKILTKFEKTFLSIVVSLYPIFCIALKIILAIKNLEIDSVATLLIAFLIDMFTIFWIISVLNIYEILRRKEDKQKWNLKSTNMSKD